jgi:hypothetical protein
MYDWKSISTLGLITIQELLLFSLHQFLSFKNVVLCELHYLEKKEGPGSLFIIVLQQPWTKSFHSLQATAFEFLIL